MKNSLNCLIELQSVDNELQRLEELKGDLPQQVEKLRANLNDAETSFNALRESLHETKKMKLHEESELAVLQDKLKKYQEQLYQVTSNREYDAITVEIDTVREKISDCETLILELIEKEEFLDEDEKTKSSELEDLRSSLESKDKELITKISSTEEQVNTFQQRRSEIIENIKRQILYQYERIRKGLGNSAVAEVNNYACGGCYSTIPPQKVVEIKMMNQLILCESCGRILVCKNEERTVATE